MPPSPTKNPAQSSRKAAVCQGGLGLGRAAGTTGKYQGVECFSSVSPSSVGRAYSDRVECPVPHKMVRPPSTGRAIPVMKEASSEARKSMTRATSSCSFRLFKLLADPPRRALRHVLARERGVRCPEDQESFEVPPREDKISPWPARHTADRCLCAAPAV